MIILACKNGQLGNRLAYLRAFMAISLEYNIPIVNLTFDEYAESFEGSNGNALCGCPGILLPRIVNRISYVILNALEPFLKKIGVYFGLKVAQPDERGCFSFLDEALRQEIKKHSVLFYAGWPVVNSQVLERHADTIRDYFSLIKGKAHVVEDFVSAAREKCDFLVGIHIRQGDYRIWQNGKFFFETHRYLELMRKIRQNHLGKKILFIICSNESQDWDRFGEFEYLRGHGGEVEDMYILARCDEIYGPQSSFSGWASFYGKTRLFWVKNPETFDVVEV
ncbi:hypothetical protein [Desulfuromonas sp. TF]|uniref:hypothetical protein n=1 Tax=Desulfuromonas sp. TF TaxID=1232410 RepID=UPI000426A6B8|nr:hypothetical protein [Desulfuromonas sp. TF]